MPKSAKEITEKYAVKEGTFEVPISDDPEETFIVRKVTSLSEMAKVRKKSQELARMGNRVLPTWKPYAPITPEIAEVVSKLTELVVQPKFTTLEALKFCHEAGMLAGFIHQQITLNLTTMAMQGEAEALDDVKNDWPEEAGTILKQTPSSPEPSTETTSTQAASG